MTDKETYLSRGYTKEGKEVIGYALPFLDKFYILDKKKLEDYSCGLAPDDHGFYMALTEITSKPQKCLGIRDCEGEFIFEGDDVKAKRSPQENEKDYKIINDTVRWRNGWFELFGFPLSTFSFKNKGETIENRLWVSECRYGDSTYWQIKDIKIIHPTNKDEIGSRS